MSPVETALLRPGHRISRIVRGGWQLAGGHGEVIGARAIADMEAFVDAGIATFDCADIYTGVEAMIGDFIAGLRRRRGGAAADRVRVHTKFVPDLSRLADLRPDEVEATVDRSLRRLRVDTLHLVQFYWWDLARGEPARVLEPLIRLREKGKIGHLGLTNWDAAQIALFLEAGFEPVSAQVQYSVLDRRPENGLARWCVARDIHLLCYGTLAGGFLTGRWLGAPDPGFAFDNRSLVKYRLIIDEFGPWSLFQDLLRCLDGIGGRHGVPLSAVATRWVLDRPQVAAAIVGARYARHLPETLKVFDFALDEEDRSRIAAVLARAGGPAGPVYGLERDRTGRHGRIMKYELNAGPDAAAEAARA